MPNKFYKLMEEMLSSIEANKPHKQIMTADEASKYMGFSKTYVYKLTSQRVLPHYKPLGKTLFFKRSEIDAWILESRVPVVDRLLEKSLINLRGTIQKRKSRS